MQHLDEGTIHAYLDGALSPVEARRVQEHLSSCSVCEAQVAVAHGLIAASSRIAGYLDAVPGKVVPIAKKKTSRWIFSAWPAAIAATLVVGVSLVSIRGKENPVLPVPPETPAVVRAKVTDSMPVAPPPRQVEPQRAAAENRNSAKAVAPEPTPMALPPANAATQKSTVAAAPPTPAPRPSDSLERARLPRLRSDLALSEVVVTGTSGAQDRPPAARKAISAGGSAAGAAVAAVATAPTMPADSVPAFVGCYERLGLALSDPVTRAPQSNVVPRTSSTPARVLPSSGYATEERYDRFALVDEAAPTPGQFAVRVLDPAGRPEGMIYGAGWSVQGDRAIVRDSKGQIVLTLTRTDSGVRAAGVRVISCR